MHNITTLVTKSMTGRKPTARKMSVRDLPVLRSELLEVLSELSRDRFFVEFNAYFSCHLLQSAVALHGLGTSKVTHSNSMNLSP